MPSHCIGILSLGPCILFYFFRGSTRPGSSSTFFAAGLVLRTRCFRLDGQWRALVVLVFVQLWGLKELRMIHVDPCGSMWLNCWDVLFLLPVLQKSPKRFRKNGFGMIWQNLEAITLYSTLSASIRLYPALSGSIRPYPLLSDFIRLYPAPSDSIRLCPTLSDSVRLYPTLSDSIRFYRSDSIRLYPAPSGSIRLYIYPTLSDSIRFYRILSDSVRLYLTLSDSIRLYVQPPIRLQDHRSVGDWTLARLWRFLVIPGDFWRGVLRNLKGD